MEDLNYYYELFIFCCFQKGLEEIEEFIIQVRVYMF